LAVDLDIYVEPELSLERPVVAVQPDLEAEVLVAVPPERDGLALRHEQSERPRRAPRIDRFTARCLAEAEPRR
jgi:hypothetical protein